MNPRAPVVIAALLACGGVAAPAFAQGVPPAVISVTGEAHLSVPPDRAEVDGGVTSEARTAREASSANNDAMARVLQALKGFGLADKDVQTSRLSLQPLSAANRNANNGSMQIVGYRASNRVTVQLHDTGKVAGAIDALVGAGANDIGGINFMVSDASKLLDDARTQAMADARRKAEIYAKAAGVTLGAPVSISEGGVSMPMQFRKMAVGIAAAPTPVAQGEDTLQVSVSVSWAIKPAP
jgi:uncharacterized protein